jgi:1-acyl-sn-glycerol-3-phosphate acyltransferase
MAYAISWLRSAVFALAFYSATLLWTITALIAAMFDPRALRAVARGWSRYHRACARWILGQRIQVIGTLPDQPGFYVFKHESMFETIDLLCFFREPVVAAKQELLDIPLWGWAARRFGIIGVERTAGAAALRRLRNGAVAAVEAGRPVCLFPEGTRVAHGEAPPLRAGFAGLYSLLRMPVVPVAVDSGKVAPRNHFVKSPGVITYRIGETVPPGLPRAEAEARVHAALNALNRTTED